MKVSIITATFNSGSTVGDTLQSVGRQSYPDIEHLIVDGASTDSTLDIVRSFDHVAKVVSEKDRGIYDAMNKGIGMAQGDVIGILNSDDVFSNKEVVSKVADLFDREQVDLVYSDLQYVDECDTTQIIRHWKAGAYDSQKFYYGWMPPHPTVFIKREVYQEYGVFNTDFRFSADYELLLRFLVRYELKAGYLEGVSVNMRTGGHSNSSMLNRWKANREDRKAWRVNGLTPYFFTIPAKPIRKLAQYFIR